MANLHQKKIVAGDKFGRLTVLNFDYKDKWNHSYFLCECVCGKTKSIRDSALKGGKVQSCGCLNIEIVKKTNRRYNKYEILSSSIMCHTNKGEVFYISKESEWVLNDYCWHKDSLGYIVSTERNRGKPVKLHSLLMKEQLGKGLEADHIDGNKLNNCLDNLRAVTKNQNQWNKFRKDTYGISRPKNCRINPYFVSLKYNGSTVKLGYFPTLDKAVKARNNWENNHERKEYFRNKIQGVN